MPKGYVRQSKFRHVFGTANRKEKCYDSIRIAKASSVDSNLCAVNPKFVAVITESAGGGSFMVLPIEEYGRVEMNKPQVCGHKDAVIDLAWSPFNDEVIASGSEDASIKVWIIPSNGLTENLEEPAADLRHHQKKVVSVVWHPIAENILMSASADPMICIWNVLQEEVLTQIDFNDLIFSICWNYNGSCIGSTSKDKKIRILDPRTGKTLQEGTGHVGSKPQRIQMLKDNKAFTTGFSKMSGREYALWDVNDLSKPLIKEEMDKENGTLMIYYDPDCSMVYLSGKGDGKINYYEITTEDPYVFWLSIYQSSAPGRGLGFMPKRGCNVNANEVARFYKVHASKNLFEPITMTVPRKSELFQDDLYPDTASNTPALTAEDWYNGKDSEPILLSMRQFFHGAVVDKGPAAKKSSNKLSKLSQLGGGGGSGASSEPKATPVKVSATPVKSEPVKQPTKFASSSKNDVTSKDQRKQIEELAAEIEQLKATVAAQGQKIESLETKLAVPNGK